MTSIVIRIAVELAPARKVGRYSKPWWGEECSRLGEVVGTFRDIETEEACKLEMKEFHNANRKAKRPNTPGHK
ncbi:unnamed protein product [Ambrosiozyma monospora]|uniref:Unnamed protein product n=1 Tax=Ambrosiozyma monospora TaxID=43982 RepID=A0A9W7DJI1_AMBMO|nr:unnamed protein product [Ambrosiozyma monospora]